MDDILTGLIYFTIPGTAIVSFLSFIVFLVVRNTKSGKVIRYIGLFLTIIGFMLSLGLTFLLLAHPYMVYSLVATGISFLTFVSIYFLKPTSSY